MSFCWFTSFIGYPNFFKGAGHSYDLGQAFVSMAEASMAGRSYSDIKDLFPHLDHAQVETKKAAFQEYGFLYAVPRSNTLTLTPLGRQIYELIRIRRRRPGNRRTILLALARALSRYQFNNPLPVGGNRYRQRAQSTDVLPYLACYYLLSKLDGILTVSELKGAIFGLQRMAKIRDLEEAIRSQRKSDAMFPQLSGLPAHTGTAENLKIYFISHLGLDGELLVSTTAEYYGVEEQCFELTQSGYELIASVLNDQWPRWRMKDSPIPTAKHHPSIADYYQNGVGQACPPGVVRQYDRRSERQMFGASKGVLDPNYVESLANLPRRKFREGTKRLVLHARLETVRSSALVHTAKRQFERVHGRLYCEVCSFDFQRQYGEPGKDYIEAHHMTPISQLTESVEVGLTDLAMVCANCHRMLHRPPWPTMDELRHAISEHGYG